MAEFFLSVQLKAVHYFKGEVEIKFRVQLSGDAQQPAHRQVEMLCKVFDVAHARIHSRRADGPAIHEDLPLGNILIPGDRLEQRRLARAVAPEQAVYARRVDRHGNAAKHRRLPVLRYPDQLDHLYPS